MPRNSSGVYTLPAGNPVVTNTLIQSSWANPTMSDIASELTNSLDRNGRGSMLAPFKNVDGAVGAPGMTFSNEPTTGFWRKTTGSIGVASSGVEVASFNSTGFISNLSVGVGTVPSVGLSNVGPILQIKGSSALSAGWVAALESTSSAWLGLYSGITVGDNPSIIFNSTGALRFGTSTAQATTSYAELMRLTAAGRLGIGRTPTGDIFEISGSAQAFGITASDTRWALTVNTIASLASGFNNSGATNGYGALTGTAYFGLAQAFPMVFATNALERIRIEAGGNVGIGTPGPASRLDTRNSTAGATVIRAANTAVTPTSFIGLECTNLTDADCLLTVSGVGAAAKFAAIGPSIAIPLLFTVTNSERMRIDASGNVGIGTTSPSSFGKLAVVGGAFDFFATPGVGGNRTEIGCVGNNQLNINTNNTPKLSITADGRIYGTALHNNAGSLTGTTNQYLASNANSAPTLTNTLNIAASTLNKFQFFRLGNLIVVGWRMSVTTAAAGLSAIEIALPIASTFAVQGDCNGSCGTSNLTDNAIYVEAMVAGPRIRINFNASASNTRTLTGMAVYEVL